MAVRTGTVVRSDGVVVCERCVLATTSFSRLKGLLGRGDLPGDEGVLLRPTGSVHTAFMRFPIDVLFLDRDLRVLKVAEDVPPWRARAARRSRAVLELRAGEAARRGVRAGDVLRVE